MSGRDGEMIFYIKIYFLNNEHYKSVNLGAASFTVLMKLTVANEARAEHTKLRC